MDANTFKSAIRCYADLALEIEKAQAEIRPLRKNMALIRHKILEHMQAKRIVQCMSSCGSWAIVRRETSRAEPLKPAHVLAELATTMNPTRAQAVVAKINERCRLLKNERLVHKRYKDKRTCA